METTTILARIARRLRSLRETLRGILLSLARRLADDDATSTENDAIEAESEHARAIAAEHALERGAFGRSRAAAVSRKPHVDAIGKTAGLHPHRTRRHA